MTTRELKLTAKSALKGKYAHSIMPVIIMAGIAFVLSVIQYTVERINGLGISLIWAIITIVISIFMIPLQVGINTYYLKMAKNEMAKISDLFWPYKKRSQMFEQIKAYFLTGLIIFVGILLFVIPGIIWSLKYSQLGFAFAENPEFKYDEAMKRSAELMKGRKGDFLILGLSFILWFLLVPLVFCVIYFNYYSTMGLDGILTLNIICLVMQGIIYVLLTPYIITTFAAFYIDISKINITAADSEKSKKIGGDGLLDDGQFNIVENKAEKAQTISPEKNEESENKDEDIFN